MADERSPVDKVIDKLDKKGGADRRGRNPDMLPWHLADQMGDAENACRFTEFTKQEAIYFAKRAALSDKLANDRLPDMVDGKPNPNKKHGLVFVDSFREHYAQFMQSVDRKSRIEVRDMVKANGRISTQGTLGQNVMHPLDAEEQQQKKGFWRRIFG